MIINAENQVLGRLSSYLAKELQKNDIIIVVNAEKAVVSGSENFILKEYKKKYDRGQKYFGPFFPKSPERILKRTVRGMLPKNKRGREALKRLKVYRKVPSHLENEKIKKINGENKLKQEKYVELGKISKYLGSRI